MRLGLPLVCRLCSGTSQQKTAGEKRIHGLLKAKFPSATHIQVADISGELCRVHRSTSRESIMCDEEPVERFGNARGRISENGMPERSM